jgi:hypothetical protein
VVAGVPPALDLSELQPRTAVTTKLPVRLGPRFQLKSVASFSNYADDQATPSLLSLLNSGPSRTGTIVDLAIGKCRRTKSNKGWKGGRREYAGGRGIANGDAETNCSGRNR